MALLIAVALGLVVFGPLCAKIAHDKGYSPAVWYGAGAVLGVLGLVVIALRRPMDADERATYRAGHLTFRVLWDTLLGR